MRQAALVVQELCVVGGSVGLAEVLRARLPNRQESFGEGARRDALQALLHGARYRRRHALAGASRKFLGQAVRLRVLNVQAHDAAFLVLLRYHSTMQASSRQY
uniref:Uncharacterized protein n=1 Tax=mine drainage metagenome TaxID=410659 RepID=E6PG46_9ZZZZ